MPFRQCGLDQPLSKIMTKGTCITASILHIHTNRRKYITKKGVKRKIWLIGANGKFVYNVLQLRDTLTGSIWTGSTLRKSISNSAYTVMYGKRYSGNESLNGRSLSHNSGFYGRVQNFNNDRSGFTFWSWNSVGDYDFSVREFNFRCFF